MGFGHGPLLALAVALPACSFPAYTVEQQLANAGGAATDPSEPSPGVCLDGKQGAKETGVDCGGICPPCSAGQGCVEGQDCESGKCADGVCQLARCNDGIRNGDEVDVDCGGVCDTRCAVDQRCNGAEDCASSVCATTCQAPSCTDGARNGSEASIDCGGVCSPCAEGQACSKPTDCASGTCSSSICVSVSCTDRRADGGESDVDCGGSCAPCTAGAACAVATDCDSGLCPSSHVCNAATCIDKIQNGSETDVDCGGSCPGCDSNQVCVSGADCSSGLCKSGACVPAAETGEQLDPKGWSGTALASDSNATCSMAFDGSTFWRWSTGQNQQPGLWFTLDLGAPQIFFKIVLRAYDTSYTEPDDGPALFDVSESNDGTFTTPVKAKLPGGPVTTIHFDAAQRARYIQFKLEGTKGKWWSVNELYVYR